MKNIKDLLVDIMPSYDLFLTWEDSGERIVKKQQALNQKIYKKHTENDKNWLLFLGCSNNKIPLSPSLNFWRTFAQNFLEKIKKYPDIENVRHKIKIVYVAKELKDIIDAAPVMTGREYLNMDLLTEKWEDLNKLFSGEIKKFSGSVKDFFHEFSPHIHLAGRVYFHLVENKDENFPFQFLATYATQSEGSKKHKPLRYALEEYKKQNEQLLELLTTVNTAAKNSDLLKRLIETGELFHHLAWDIKEAYEFLQQIHTFEHCGIICRIPDWWKKQGAKPVIKVNLGSKEPAFVGKNALLDFKADIYIGDDPISVKEIEELLAESNGLARIKNRWIEVDKAKLQNLLTAYEKAIEINNNAGLTIREALQLQFHPEKLSSAGDETNLEISNGEWLENIIKKLKQPELTTSVKPSKDFSATLRQYQQKGLNWLYFLDSLGFGACLADDMGLGKTIQILGFLSILKLKEKDRTSLLIIPASLISNWENEINRFLPNLKYHIAHPGYINSGDKQKNKDKKQNQPVLKKFDLVITTYAMAQRHEWMKDFPWRCLILDEAQAIKNPITKQTKCVKKLKADTKITMTGTPIENRLSDLWSLFDFLNPGLLGNAREFKSFSGKLKNEPAGYRRLKKIVSPFLLRRMKTDKSIAPDLPEKIEMKTFPELTKKQVVLYTDFVEELKSRLVKAEQGIQRKGLILSSLMKFKQICNHPDQYLGTGEFAPEESGKFIRLGELCETIYAKRERVLVFTQFKEMTNPIAGFLATIFHHKGCIIHGSVNVKKRKQVIEEFQKKEYVPFMVLSLKAGGVGLNLTRANHVIHFDRWWNPAVENQATDRAFRIGQKKGVLVHKFITKGTIEDKIDAMIENKKELSKKIISNSGTNGLITEMNNSQLLNMFKLKI
ncbi:MAG: DEAD/DEAH box helicase [Desulfobacterales bacterium]|nr:DEAD/DEAH box helicase [Desulfobacterales bacterium]